MTIPTGNQDDLGLGPAGEGNDREQGKKENQGFGNIFSHDVFLFRNSIETTINNLSSKDSPGQDGYFSEPDGAMFFLGILRLNDSTFYRSMSHSMTTSEKKTKSFSFPTMRTCVLLLVFFAPFGCRDAGELGPKLELADFTSDGCSLFIDGTFANPELWKECCQPLRPPGHRLA